MVKFLALTATLCLITTQSFAEEVTASADMIPPQSAETTTLDGALPSGEFPLLRLTPDKIEVVKLDRDATNIIVGNNKHLVAVMETSRQVLLVPRAPGATHFQALDAEGKTIMERSVIIAAPKQDYVRVRRTCGKDDSRCQEYSVFYCPDMCHQVATTSLEKSSSTNLTVPDETATAAMPPETVNDGEPVPPATITEGSAPPPPATTGLDSQ